MPLFPVKADVLVDIMLRIPPMFLIDIILSQNDVVFSQLGDVYTSSMFYAATWLLLVFTCLCSCVFVFLLETENLSHIYSYVASLATVLASYSCNHNYMEEVFGKPHKNMKEDGTKEDVRLNAALKVFPLQVILGYFYVKLWENRENINTYTNVGKAFVKTGSNVALVFPLLLNQFINDVNVFWKSILLSISFPLLILFIELVSSLGSFLRNCHIFQDLLQAVENIGIFAYLEQHWVRLRFPKLLRIYFVLRMLILFIYFYMSRWQVTPLLDSMDSESFVHLDLIMKVLHILTIKSCDNLIALMALTSIVSFFVHYLGIFLAFCVGSTDEDDRNMGTVSAILFFILALQTGLTSLEPVARLARLHKNMYLLGTAITHFVHSMVHPKLLTISASHVTNVASHLRLLLMCVLLVIFPASVLYYLWSVHTISTWLLAVTAFSLEVIIKVIISLLVYLLFMIDAYRNTFWEKLDDYVYYVQSTGNSIEFLFGIFLFCNGAWILIFESGLLPGSSIRAVMMCIHAYCNIWLQAKKGWKEFIQRRQAVQKINSLHVISGDEISETEVCAICYQELTVARVTRCRHMFHGVCLRKWLYVQDYCPLCHKVIYEQPVNSDIADKSNGHQAATPRHPVEVQNNGLHPHTD